MAYEGRRRYDPEASRQDILDAAERLFIQKGVDGASTAEIARAAGVSQSQIHYHFQTKENLWHTLVHQKFHDYYEVQTALLDAGDRTAQTIADSIRLYFRFFQNNPSFARLMMWQQLRDNDPAEGFMQEGRTLIQYGVETIRQGQEAGILRSDVDPRAVLMSFLGAVEHYFMTGDAFCRKMGMVEDKNTFDETQLETLARIFERGLQPAPSDTPLAAPGGPQANPSSGIGAAPNPSAASPFYDLPPDRVGH
jgi:AcrR family transcriptional regulator